MIKKCISAFFVCAIPLIFSFMTGCNNDSDSETSDAELLTLLETQTATFEESDFPGSPIPDTNSSGVEDTITINPTGFVKSVQVDISITHPSRGDISITLTLPDETNIILKETSTDSGDDIQETYTVPGSFGIDADGTWILKVADLTAGDSGTLDEWTVRVYTWDF